jgi:hypothetical protein
MYHAAACEEKMEAPPEREFAFTDLCSGVKSVSPSYSMMMPARKYFGSGRGKKFTAKEVCEQFYA